MKKLFILSVILLAASALQGQIIRIPADRTTIQKGIDAAKAGDTVLVSPGTYVENINYKGKSITVASLFLTTRDTSYISRTIIDGNKAGSVVTFNLSEKDESVLSGFTITNGGNHYGGGISCISSSPFIEHVTIRNNSSYLPWFTQGFGGGVYCMESSPVLEDVIITGNIAQSGNTFGLIESSSGGGIACYHSNPILRNVSITNNTAANGGGIACFDSRPTLVNVLLSDNYASYGLDRPRADGTNSAGSSCGGGLYCSGSNPEFQNVTIINNTAYDKGGGIFCDNSIPVFSKTNRCSFYSNTALEGNDLYSASFMEVVVDTFTVAYPHDFHAAPIANFSFDIRHGVLVQADCDLFVSPDGDNNLNGLSAESPLRTIRHAFSIIRADSLHQNSINLLPGTYSQTSNNEVFPINMPDYVSLAGAGKTEVILDAEGTTRVIQFIRNTAGSIYGMTVRGGWVTNANGGGIYCLNSNPDISQVIITGNSAPGSGDTFEGFNGGVGGGIHCENSSPTLHNVSISENSAGFWGGGISCSNSAPVLQDVKISGNEATGTTYGISNPGGGGMYCINSSPDLQNVMISGNSSIGGGGIFAIGSQPVLKKVTLTDNTATRHGGGIYFGENSNFKFDTIGRCNIYFNKALTGNDLYSLSPVSVVVDTFSVLRPNAWYANSIQKFSFDILHGKLAQVNSDVYVVFYGDDSNSGLTSASPFKTIRHAILVLRADSLNPHTIHLMNGYYGPSPGESFPLMIPDYVNLAGSGKDYVTIDVSGAEDGFFFDNNFNFTISGFTVSHATGAGVRFDHSGGLLKDMDITNNCTGICLENNSNPTLQSIQVSNNTEGGISCEYSNPVLKKVTIIGNSNYGMDCLYSAPVLENVKITANNGTGFIFGGGDEPAGLLEDVVISKNEGYYGGGMYTSGKGPEFRNVSVIDNMAFFGGGAYVYGQISGVSFLNNTAKFGGGIFVPAFYSERGLLFSNLVIGYNVAQYGGGIYSESSSEVKGTIFLQNVTLTENAAIKGGGICSEKGGRIALNNSILWNDYPQEVYLNRSTLTVNYSDVQGGKSAITKMNGSTLTWNSGNIASDPLFTGSLYAPFSLSAGSPCIDTGTDSTGLPLPEKDILGFLRKLDGNLDGVAIIDMGAYEFVSGATGVEDFDTQSSALAIRIFPNPFSSATAIEYQLSESGYVNLNIYNNIGQPVAALVNEFRPQGRQQVEWNAEGMPAGIYYFRLKAGDQAVTGRMVKL